MITSMEDFEKLIKKPEDMNLEFKEAKISFSEDKDLLDYCAALANEGGGKLILGVNNVGGVVGSDAFKTTYNKLSHKLFNCLGIRIDVEEFFYSQRRVLIFHVPPRPVAKRVKSRGRYLYPMRAGESLVEMDDETTRKILNEVEPDFSSKIVKPFYLTDIDEKAVNNFQFRWSQKSNRSEYTSFSIEKTLSSIDLLSDKGLNYAALILFGKKEKICELLPCNEIIFEWRQEHSKVSYDYRKTWRDAFFNIYDEIWETINVRNLRIPFQEGLFQREIYAFSEKPIREALLNAIAHRDYTINGQSVFIKASPESFFIESPGGFPGDININNVLSKTYWRNRVIAEIFEKAELVERSGQGMNDIFGMTIREGKGMPDLSKTDSMAVRLEIPAQVKDKNFILFLEKLSRAKQIDLSFEEIYELEKIRENQTLNSAEFKKKFLENGIIERIGKTRSSKYILSHNYYSYEGRPGIYTRISGLSREKQKELIVRHLTKNKKGYLKDFIDVFPELKTMDISNFLQELKREGKIEYRGARKTGFWIMKN